MTFLMSYAFLNEGRVNIGGKDFSVDDRFVKTNTESCPLYAKRYKEHVFTEILKHRFYSPT